MASSLTKAHPLAVAQRLLQTLGNSGKYIWQTSKQFEDMRERLDYLMEAIQHLKARADEGIDKYHEPPVDPRTFVLCPLLMGKGEEVYPKVLEEFVEMCSGRYVEAVLTGGIGTGKTTIALYAIAYTLYELSCMKSPHRVFGIDSASEIMFVFQSLKKELSKAVDYERFKAMIDSSPYFQTEFRYDRGIESQLEFPKRIIVKPLTGAATAAIGQNVFGGVIDEVNFMQIVEQSKQARDGGTYDQATQIYNSIARRRESRFMSAGGKLPGMLCLVSSKQYPGEFTDRKIEQAKKNPRIFVYDKRVWEVKPIDTFSGEWFWVFTGDVSRKPRILAPGEEKEFPLDDQPLLMRIPTEYRSSFEESLLDALRDIAGVSTLALHPFILDTESVADAFGKVQSIASRPDCDFVSTKIKVYPKLFRKPTVPRFAHFDLSMTGDSTGVAIGHVTGFADIARGEEVEKLPIIDFDMILEVRPPKGGEIQFHKIRELLYTLRDLGLPIKWVTFDTFQSTDSKQILGQRGFVTGIQSMDTDTLAYDVSKQAFYDRRVLAPEHHLAQMEWVRLERDPVKRTIDHPANFSKDCSDAMAGVIYGLTMRREIWSLYGVPLTRIPKHLLQQETTGHKNNLSYMDAVKQKKYA